jgi:uncharacterized membrane protein YhaH (DUF805 family)
MRIRQPTVTHHQIVGRREDYLMSICLQPLKKYADFNGRASRLEFWSFYLLYYVVMIPLVGLGFWAYFAESMGLVIFLFVLGVLFSVGTIIPYLAVSVRRLHDRGMSGWWALLWFAPYINVAVLILAALPGDEGDNEYGPDPKALGE